MCNVDFWFAMHRPIMMTVPVLSVAGFIAIFYYKNWTWVSSIAPINFAHSITGIITVALSVVQPFMALLRPDKKANNRYIFNWAHRTVGMLALSLSIVTVFLGAKLFLDIEGGSKVWLGLLVFWVFWMFVLPITLELIEFRIRKNGDTSSANQGLLSYKSEEALVPMPYQTVKILNILTFMRKTLLNFY